MEFLIEARARDDFGEIKINYTLKVVHPVTKGFDWLDEFDREEDARAFARYYKDTYKDITFTV